MDTFFSLFDPADSVPNKPKKLRYKPPKTDTSEDTAKRKPDAPGRKKKKPQIKHESLPEESSFLCDPDLTTDLLVKDISYIESFIAAPSEPRKDREDSVSKKADCDKKVKRRNSARKNRRKKNKISPSKDLLPNFGWNEAESLNFSEQCIEYNINNPRHSEEKVTNWNNKSNYRHKKVKEDLGKNVNDLHTEVRSAEKSLDYGKRAQPFAIWQSETSDVSTEPSSEEKEVYNVIEKLEKVSLKDDIYMAGDFNTEDLENDMFYSSDDLEESLDDSSSDLEESGDEAYGSLPPEPRFGNVEYKLQLVSPSEKRFQHLVTQLKWRLRSGGGSAVYVVGVRDCGALRGLRARALRASLHTLRRMARALRAELRHVTARRVAQHRAVAEVYIRKLADTQQSVELRVAVMGANEAGKSTLIGVLTQGELDNGRGSARLNMFRHLHEVRSGRTSSLSHEILGFDSQGNVVNYGCSELMTAERIGERSAKLVSFLDLAGHRKYQRTTVHGLTGYSPHYAMLVVSATAGISRMTEEHISLLLALDMPFFIVVTKLDLAPGDVDPLLERLQLILDSGECRKRPLLITDEHLARTCVAPPQLILGALDPALNAGAGGQLEMVERVPVFPVSCVRGAGLGALHGYLLALDPPALDLQPGPEEEACEFQIDEIFHVGESAGPVVGGLLARGRLAEGAELLIGPLDTGEFVGINVKTIYRNRVPCGSVKAGQSASLGLSRFPPNLRQGMVLVAIPDGYNMTDNAKAKSTTIENAESRNLSEISDLVKAKQISMKNSPKTGKQSKSERSNIKHARRKEMNILRDLANVENCLVKDLPKDLNENLYKSDSDNEIAKSLVESDTEALVVPDVLKEMGVENCRCCRDILLEDLNDPRGCLFFQATVRVLRHSTAIYPGFQATVHIGNVRQTAVIEGILSWNSVLRAGEEASVLFRFARQPEYVRAGRRMLFRAGLETRGVGTVTQVFPHEAHAQ